MRKEMIYFKFEYLNGKEDVFSFPYSTVDEMKMVDELSDLVVESFYKNSGGVIKLPVNETTEIIINLKHVVTMKAELI